jgi:survival motor neuron (SMN) interacting protein 1 (SIP1)
MYFTHWFNLYLGSLDANSNNDDKTTGTYAPTDIHMRWIFALLTRIDLFCSADEMSCLRNLARACLALISVVRRRKVGSSQPSADDEQTDRTTEMDTSGAETYTTRLDSSGDHKTLSECSIWVVFCAVTSIWGQRDLWDDADEALRQHPL